MTHKFPAFSYGFGEVGNILVIASEKGVSVFNKE
jgi:hypothetical protein